MSFPSLCPIHPKDHKIQRIKLPRSAAVSWLDSRGLQDYSRMHKTINLLNTALNIKLRHSDKNNMPENVREARTY
jgi:hypothetical protein